MLWDIFKTSAAPVNQQYSGFELDQMTFQKKLHVARNGPVSVLTGDLWFIFIIISHRAVCNDDMKKPTKYLNQHWRCVILMKVQSATSLTPFKRSLRLQKVKGERSDPVIYTKWK